MAAAAPEPGVPEVPEASVQPEGPEDPAGTGNDVKRRFREALERKQAQQADANAAHQERGTSKARLAHGPAHTRRSFRRKSG
ncbi:MAG TPA: DUF5302 domain-containing protein [Mycobacteriales bacterium]|jgi:hypothetical protein